MLYGKALGRHLKEIPLINIVNRDAAQERDFEGSGCFYGLKHDGAEFELIRGIRPKDLIDTPREDAHFDSKPGIET